MQGLATFKHVSLRSHVLRVALAAFAAVLLVGVLTPISASALSGSQNKTAEQQFLTAINQDRAANGLAPVKLYWNLTDDARTHSADMMHAGNIYHTSNLAAVASGWSGLAENVGAGPTVSSLQSAFMASPGHRANILGNYTHVGIGVYKSTTGQLWVTVIFGRWGSNGSGYSAFKDSDNNPHRAAIEYIWEHGITSGCGSVLAQTYCPSSTVTRAEMAVFLVRALNLPNTSHDYFTDDNGHWAENSINRLAAAGIVSGCATNKYCPNSGTTRGQMAKMLVKGFHMPMAPSSKDYFTDDDGKWFENYADTLRYYGITSGCGSGRFCGYDPMKRDQMATFLQRSMDKF